VPESATDDLGPSGGWRLELMPNTRKIDLVIIDVGLPDIDGYHAI
jgi:DNA-binding response OmpR family regulator